ncbi:type II toxin-antitoxin system antitoxin DNA ADP-ribosyl glycohydrolase DarG [Prosthecomicrobium pneumaticum]|uniref:O-acetyl-ADP-ribose deacetylase (Regulator of RNase III) n=1 Tax=Prosthecomicrobium pneumaticum TaxID=81895 RepID=A0A7W9FMF0_9HYPH|nr:macro domain-containing protein [Prosthecomicrobium pneumaticum]MBB5753378.1 O-acetyl-ADP-ribose deacetylase (regulator of RNase III) [Prosthecomicrobium pneumaticum]
MVKFVHGNLLEADTEALVNTVNTVGVMGKGIALMFKEAFPENFKLYEAACDDKRVRLGEMFVTKRNDLYGPKWIINFPTKSHWRYPSKIEWIAKGLDDLKAVVECNNIRSIAIPPLGAGNGGLDWPDVRKLIVSKLDSLKDVEVVIYEPTRQYQNVAKRTGVDKLTPARALIAELVRRYCVLGIQCSLLEVQKLGYFVERFANRDGLGALHFEFGPNKYGPYSDRMKHMLNALDGSYLHCDKRLGDAGPFEPIRFDDGRKELVSAYFSTTDAKPYRAALEATSKLIDGFESPLGMELLATVDWLVCHEKIVPQVSEIRAALRKWPGGEDAAERKLRLFDDRIIKVALDALKESSLVQQAS